MAITQFSTNALVLAPPFWPNLPPLSLVHIASYLLAQGQSISLFDLNNKFYNLADEKLKKAWMVSSNIQLEENIVKDIIEKPGKDKRIGDFYSIP